jgi:hypothetical protein
VTDTSPTPAAPEMTPTVDDVLGHLGAMPGGPVQVEQVEKALSTARKRILDRCIDMPADLPELVEHAIVMLAARLYRRRFSVGGFEGFGDLGLARVPALDPDIEDLLVRYLRYDFA